jgi:hypothetical protein
VKQGVPHYVLQTPQIPTADWVSPDSVNNLNTRAAEWDLKAQSLCCSVKTKLSLLEFGFYLLERSRSSLVRFLAQVTPLIPDEDPFQAIVLQEKWQILDVLFGLSWILKRLHIAMGRLFVFVS